MERYRRIPLFRTFSYDHMPSSRTIVVDAIPASMIVMLEIRFAPVFIGFICHSGYIFMQFLLLYFCYSALLLCIAISHCYFALLFRTACSHEPKSCPRLRASSRLIAPHRASMRLLAAPRVFSGLIAAAIVASEFIMPAGRPYSVANIAIHWGLCKFKGLLIILRNQA